jgi:hypothetical protein
MYCPPYFSRQHCAPFGPNKSPHLDHLPLPTKLNELLRAFGALDSQPYALKRHVAHDTSQLALHRDAVAVYANTLPVQGASCETQKPNPNDDYL